MKLNWVSPKLSTWLVDKMDTLDLGYNSYYSSVVVFFFVLFCHLFSYFVIHRWPTIWTGCVSSNSINEQCVRKEKTLLNDRRCSVTHSASGFHWSARLNILWFPLLLKCVVILEHVFNAGKYKFNRTKIAIYWEQSVMGPSSLSEQLKPYQFRPCWVLLPCESNMVLFNESLHWTNLKKGLIKLKAQKARPYIIPGCFRM